MAKGMKGGLNSSKPLKIMKGGGSASKTLGGSKKQMPAFGAKGVKAGAGNRF